MDRFCIRMANPGKCGFFMLGMFFMLAFASFTIVYRSQVPQEIENTEYFGEDDPEHIHSGSTFDNVLSRQASHKQRLAERVQARMSSARAATKEWSPARSDEENTDSDQPLERIPTFLATMEHSFIDVHLTADGQIPTPDFLEACAGPKDLLTGLGSIMTKVWDDVGGNIKTLHMRYESNPSRFATVEDIVRADIESEVALNDDSAAMAVLWLKRAFDFVAEFFDNMRLGKDPHTAAVDAYGDTLARYHSFWIRPVFYAGMKMLGSTEDFFSVVALHASDLDRDEFRPSALSDMEEYTIALEKLLTILDDFMTKNDLNI